MSKLVIKRKVANKGFFKRGRSLDEIVKKAQKDNPKIELPQFRAGDTVRVSVRIKEGDKERIQAYEGAVIRISNKGASRSFTVRKMSHGVGVERIFLVSSPKIAKLEVLQAGRVRRAKLYYIRELEGRAAKIEREVETQAQVAASEASRTQK